MGSRWDRSPGWLGAVTVYLPTLATGVLPWSGWWLANARRPRLSPLRSNSPGLLLGLWFAMPLTVFVLASSRLPLYLLPLFAPFALVTGRGCGLGVERSVENAPPTHRRPTRCLVRRAARGKVFAAHYSTYRDARLQAAWIAAQGVGAESELMIIDTALNGLRLYGYPELHWVRARTEAYPLFTPLRSLVSVTPELASQGHRMAVVVSSPSWVKPVERQWATVGYACEARRSNLRIALLLCSPDQPDHQ